MTRFFMNQRSTTDEAIVTRQSEVQLAHISPLASNQGNYSSNDFGSSIQELEGFKKQTSHGRNPNKHLLSMYKLRILESLQHTTTENS